MDPTSRAPGPSMYSSASDRELKVLGSLLATGVHNRWEQTLSFVEASPSNLDVTKVTPFRDKMVHSFERP